MTDPPSTVTLPLTLEEAKIVVSAVGLWSRTAGDRTPTGKRCQAIVERIKKVLPSVDESDQEQV